MSPDPPVELAKLCPGISSESHYCVTVAGVDDKLLAVSPFTGEACSLANLSGNWDQHSIAVVGEHVHTCSPRLRRLGLTAKSFEEAKLQCHSVTAYGTGLLVYGWAETLQHLIYPSFDDVVAGLPVDTLSIDDDSLKTVVVGRRQLWRWTRFAQEPLEVYDLPGGSPAGTVLLSDFADWSNGFDVTDDGRIFVLQQSSLLSFDAQSGALLSRVELSVLPPHALECWSNQ